MRTTVMTLMTYVLAVVALSAAAAGQAQTPPAALEGAWTGTVTADIGQMAISATLAVKDGVVSGTLTNAHGAFTIAEGKLVDGKWILPFTTPDGAKGKLTGTVKGEEFSGEWDFRPQAFGTFTLTRVRRV